MKVKTASTGKKHGKEGFDACCAKVYVLHESNGSAWSYVGYTINLADRLRKHNNGTGATATKSKHCMFHAVYTGFKSKEDADSFESAMISVKNAVSH